jgi:electron transport complex protein RnfC
MIWWRRRPAEPAATPVELLDEQLSAFIDGDLSEADARAIEARLTAEPELRDALSGMQQVRDALVALGESAAPRAFTLEAPPTRAGLPRMELFARLGAAVSALALAAVLVGDVVTTAEPLVQPASQQQLATTQAAAAPAAAPADTEGRATSEGQATTEQATAEAQAEAASAATPEVATLAAPASAPAAAPATTDAADETEAAPAAAPAAAPSPAQAADGGRASEPEPSDTTASTAEQAAVELPQPSLADPGGDALDAAQLALLALLLIFGVAAVWQFARRPR